MPPGTCVPIVIVSMDIDLFSVVVTGMGLIVVSQIVVATAGTEPTSTGPARGGPGQCCHYVAEAGHLLLDRSKVTRPVMQHRHGARCDRHCDILHARYPPNCRIDLGRAGRAIHAIHPVSGQGRRLGHRKPLA